MAVRQKWPWIRSLCHGFTRPVSIIGASSSTEKKARKNAVCTLSTSAESRRIIALLEVKMKPPLTSHSAPCMLGGRRRSWATARRTSDLPLAAGPVGGAQILLQHLADRAARQGRREVDRLRRLHPAQSVLGERYQLVGRGSGAGLELDHRLDRLAPFFVGHADDGAV